MPQRILGIDVGAWSVKGVLLEDSFRGFRVESVEEVRVIPGDAETRADRLKEAIRGLLAALPVKVDAFIAALPGEVAAARFVEMPYSDPKKVAATIGSELSDTLAFDLDDAVFDHTIAQKLEGGASIALAVATPTKQLKDYLELLQGAGVDPKHLGVDTLELYDLYTHFLSNDLSKAEAPAQAAPDASTFIVPAPGGPPSGRLMVDIGHERTLLSAATDRGIAYQRVIRIGAKDITRAIAEGLKVPFDRAEEIKHTDGFVASSRHPASTEAQQRMSELVAQGLTPLARELRRSLQAIRAEKRAVITRIDLLGGGSRIRNLANRLAEELNIPAAPGLAVEQIVERHVDAARRPAFALALACALHSAGTQRVSPIDLRRGEFQFAGQLLHLRERVPAIALSAAAILLLLGLNTVVSYHQLIRRERAIDEQFCQITKTVIGREICEPKEAISVMRQPGSELGTVHLPERSALNVAAELSDRIPKEVEVLIDEMDITPDRARVSGETSTFDAVDSMVSEYAKDSCYTNLKKGKLRKRPEGDRVEFQLAMDMGCS